MAYNIAYFRCLKCGRVFPVATNWRNMSDEAYKEITRCTCGSQAKCTDAKVEGGIMFDRKYDAWKGRLVKTSS